MVDLSHAPGTTASFDLDIAGQNRVFDDCTACVNDGDPASSYGGEHDNTDFGGAGQILIEVIYSFDQPRDIAQILADIHVESGIDGVASRETDGNIWVRYRPQGSPDFIDIDSLTRQYTSGGTVNIEENLEGTFDVNLANVEAIQAEVLVRAFALNGAVNGTSFGTAMINEFRVFGVVPEPRSLLLLAAAISAAGYALVSRVRLRPSPAPGR